MATRGHAKDGQKQDDRRLNDLSAKEWVKLTKSWFVVDGKPKDISPDIELHPASFPPEMIVRFLRYFTRAGETVLDPFAGTGGTLAAAYECGRKGIGIELQDTYYENTQKRLAGLQQPDLFAETHRPIVYQGDARDLLEIVKEPVHFCITSPPYWNMLTKSRGNVDSVLKKRAARGLPTDYGDHCSDLGMIESYDKYLDEVTSVFRDLTKLLVNDRYVVVIMQNIRTPDGEMRPLAWDFASRMRQHYVLQQEYIWCQNQKPLGCWGYPYAYVSNVHHHYCLVFKNSR